MLDASPFAGLAPPEFAGSDGRWVDTQSAGEVFLGPAVPFSQPLKSRAERSWLLPRVVPKEPDEGRQKSQGRFGVAQLPIGNARCVHAQHLRHVPLAKAKIHSTLPQVIA